LAAGLCQDPLEQLTALPKPPNGEREGEQEMMGRGVEWKGQWI